MTQPDHRRTPRPSGRTDSTRPPGARRDTDRRPYPTAPNRTTPSRPGTRRTSTASQPRTASATPTPATVWACGPTPIDPDAAWPAPIITTILTSFSTPGSRVVLLPWPTVTEPASNTAAGVIDHAPGTEPDPDLATALELIERLDRTGRVERIPANPSLTGPVSRPFWADLVGDTDSPLPSASNAEHGSATDLSADARDGATGTADLIITSLPPEHSGDHSSDQVALLAARLLRVGGILTVLTHSDWSRGRLVDPTGPVVAAAQNADLLYLQHIVALLAPVRNGEFVTDLDDAATEGQARTQHRAQVRGLPAPHQRIHADLLVFANPHDRQPSSPAAGSAVRETGVLR